VVNDEIITYSEIMNAQAQWLQEYKAKMSGEELEKAVKEMKKNLLKNMIDRKVIISKAKQKNYDLANDVEVMLRDIKKQNNINSDEELIRALQTEGITLDEYKEELKNNRMQQRFVGEEIGTKISVDNSEIMEYYKQNIDEFTKPPEISLNCIFLNRTNYPDTAGMEQKAQEISAQLNEGNFVEMAEKHSEIGTEDNKAFLGKYKKGELDQKIEEAGFALEKGKLSDWVKTDNGWYILQLIEKSDAQLVEYKEVSDKISTVIQNEKYQKEFKKLVEKLKKDSYIKIYREDLF
jgi:peptidyl-prolyl cis-trans isomerase SurA